MAAALFATVATSAPAQAASSDGCEDGGFRLLATGMSSTEVLASASPRLEELVRAEVHPVLGASAARAGARHPSLGTAVNAPLETAAGALVRLSEGTRRLVIGGPATGHLVHVLLVSVALPVVAHAHCPVIVVPAGTAVSTPRRIVVGVDGSDAGRHAVEFAFQTAEVCGAGVTAVLVWHVEAEGGVVVTERSIERRAAAEKRYEAMSHEVIDPVAPRHPGVEVGISVLHGSPATVLRDAGADCRPTSWSSGAVASGGSAASSSVR